MNKHTPGPWHVCTATHPDLGPIRSVATQEGDGVDCVCIVDQLPGCDESTANARLIAAAPELLEALKTLQIWCGLDRYSDTWINSGARDAIAKAEEV